jgi:hypothetical protein
MEQETHLAVVSESRAMASLSNGLGGNGICAAGRARPSPHSRRHRSQAMRKVYGSLLARTPA